MAAHVNADTPPELRAQVYRYLSRILPVIDLPLIVATTWLSPHRGWTLLFGALFPIWGVLWMQLASRRALRFDKPMMIGAAVNLGLFCSVSGPDSPAWLEAIVYLTALMYLVPQRAWRLALAVGGAIITLAALRWAGREPRALIGIALALFTCALLLFRTLRVVIDQNDEIDRLLHNVFPSPIAIELKQQMTVKPVLHRSVSVLFTDVVGFTQSAERMSPATLLSELDALFSRFDDVSERHHLEKLKTIGDAYMCAGGIPVPNATHAVDCVLAALEMRALMLRGAEAHGQDGPGWKLRMGIHTGSLVAGVIGSKRFAYDIWGDTVNVASRMESSSAPNEINISRQTYEQVKAFFECEYRGQRSAKGKGELEMYFVRGLLPELAADPGRLVPNSAFERRYEELARTPRREG